MHPRILNILITGSLFHFPLDYRRYLHVVAARAQLSPSILPRDSFSPAPCVFFSRTFPRTFHIFPYVSGGPAKRESIHSGSQPPRYFLSYYCPVLTTLRGYASVRAREIPRNFEISFVVNSFRVIESTRLMRVQ